MRTLASEAFKSIGLEITDEEAGKRGYEIYDKVVTEQLQDLKSSGIPYPRTRHSHSLEKCVRPDVC